MKSQIRPRIARLMSAVMACSLITLSSTPSEASAASVICEKSELTIKSLVNETRVANLITLAGCENSIADGNVSYVANYSASPATFIAGASLVDSSTTLFTDPSSVGYTAQDLTVSDPTNFRMSASVVGTFEITLTVTPYDLSPTPEAGTPTDISVTFITVATLPAAPICRFDTVFTTTNTVIADLEISYNETTLNGCKSTESDLTFSISDLNHTDSVSINQIVTGQPITVRYDPQNGFTEPQDWDDNSDRASFKVTATDPFGQSDSEIQVVAVVRPRACGITSPTSQKSQVLFNNPDGDIKSQFIITNTMLKYIDCAQRGSIVVMSWFSLTDPNIVKHLQEAHNAGVIVRFLINSHASTNPNFKTLRRTLGDTAPANSRNGNSPIGGSWALYCNHGCLTPPAPPGLKFSAESEAEYPALHAKFFMVSNIGRGVSVVGVGSNNPTRAQAIQGWNNMQFMVEQGSSLRTHKTYQAFSSYFAKLSSQGISPHATKSLTGSRKPKSYSKLTTLGKTNFTTFPRPSTANSDDITSLFRQVKCRYKDSKGNIQRTQIYINMFVFTRNSPAMSLWHLANNPSNKNGGCQVHIIYTDMDSAIKDGSKYLNKRNGYVSYGVADCLSTPPTVGGRYKTLTEVSRRKVYDSKGKVVKVNGKIRYQTVTLCSRGSLNGRKPTISSGVSKLCWLNTKSAISGGTIEICASSYMALTKLDPADGRTKLEAWKGCDIGPSRCRLTLTKFSHQKYILIDGMVNGKIQKLTYSGTPNLTSPGLRYNDEILITSADKSIYDAYYKNFNQMHIWVKKRSAAGHAPYLSCGAYTSCS